ncbi:MAG: hypothetical protein ACXWMH_10100 [Syntrophales bacterium]
MEKIAQAGRSDGNSIDMRRKRKEAEEALKASEISYRHLLEGREISMCGSKARIGGDTFGKPYTYCR